MQDPIWWTTLEEWMATIWSWLFSSWWPLPLSIAIAIVMFDVLLGLWLGSSGIMTRLRRRSLARGKRKLVARSMAEKDIRIF